MERVAETSKHEPSSAGAGQARVASPSSASLPPALELQQLAGNQAMQQLLRSGYIQAKLAISNPDDLEEREADNVAHTVMRKAAGAPPSSPCSCSHDGEMCEECQQKQSAPLIQRRATAPSAPPHIPRVVSDVLRSPGYPLDVSTRAFFEPRFGRDFSDVRIHTSSDAAASARSINAHAYTAGSDIVFASSQYAPDTTLGRTLLAHELTHVMQQPKAAGAAAQTLQRSPDDLYKPTFDTDEQWRYGRAPLTASASMPPLAMVRKGQSSVTATAALKDLIERFPFLEPLAVSYRKVVEGVLGKDAADFNDARRVDTAVNRDYVEMASHAYSLPKDARRLMELGKFESIAANEARTEKIWPGWILSEAPIDVPSSPLAESDGRTYL